MELSHVYKDIKAVFKKYHYKCDEISIDNMKDEL
jgi:hypothetical protein